MTIRQGEGGVNRISFSNVEHKRIIEHGYGLHPLTRCQVMVNPVQGYVGASNSSPRTFIIQFENRSISPSREKYFDTDFHLNLF